MEEKMIERPLMSEEEFMKHIKFGEDTRNEIEEDFNNGIIHLISYEGVSKFKSIRRAIKRGLVSPYGEVYPKRPFNNAANTCKRGHHSRKINELKKSIYEQLKRQGKTAYY